MQLSSPSFPEEVLLRALGQWQKTQCSKLRSQEPLVNKRPYCSVFLFGGSAFPLWNSPSPWACELGAASGREGPSILRQPEDSQFGNLLLVLSEKASPGYSFPEVYFSTSSLDQGGSKLEAKIGGCAMARREVGLDVVKA